MTALRMIERLLLSIPARASAADAEIQGGLPETSFATLARICGSIVGRKFGADPANPFLWRSMAAVEGMRGAGSGLDVRVKASWDLDRGETCEASAAAALLGVEAATIESLADAAAQCERAANIGWTFASTTSSDDNVALAQRLAGAVRGLGSGESILLPVVWRTNSGGHAIATLVEGGDGSVPPFAAATPALPAASPPSAAAASAAAAAPEAEDRVAPKSSEMVLTVINTGSGLGFHPTGGPVAAVGSPKFRTALALSGIKPEALASVPFWLQCMESRPCPSDREPATSAARSPQSSTSCSAAA